MQNRWKYIFVYIKNKNKLLSEGKGKLIQNRCKFMFWIKVVLLTKTFGEKIVFTVSHWEKQFFPQLIILEWVFFGAVHSVQPLRCPHESKIKYVHTSCKLIPSVFKVFKLHCIKAFHLQRENMQCCKSAKWRVKVKSATVYQLPI